MSMPQGITKRVTNVSARYVWWPGAMTEKILPILKAIKASNMIQPSRSLPTRMPVLKEAMISFVHIRLVELTTFALNKWPPTKQFTGGQSLDTLLDRIVLEPMPQTGSRRLPSAPRPPSATQSFSE